MKYKVTQDLTGKVVIVTGCSAGIGLETALKLYEANATVIMANRSLSKSYEVIVKMKDMAPSSKGKLEVIELDLASLKSVEAFVKSFLAMKLPLHYLINNAGIAMADKDAVTKDGFELIFGVNHLSHFLLTLLLLPKLVETSNSQTKPVRIITVSSQFHSYGILPYNFDEIKNGKSGGYGLSKLANIHFSKELSNQLKQAGLSDKIHTYSLHPGFVSTGIWGTSNWGWYLKPIEFLFHLFLTTEEDGAATTLYCTLDDQCEKESGLYYDQCKVAEPLPSAKDETAMKELWEHSLKLTGAKWKLK